MSDEVDIVNPKKKGSGQNNNLVYKIVLGIVTVAIVGGIGFYCGISYQKSHFSTAASSTSNRFGGSRSLGDRFAGNRAIGTVSSISSSSITVNTNSGNKTFSINSTTLISDNGQTASVSDIKTGDTVFVIASSSTSTTATRILVNPSFGGFGGAGFPGQGSSQGSNTQGSTTPGSSTSNGT